MNSTIPPKIYEILKRVVNANLENFVITVHDANKKGEGYLGQMFFISLKNKDNGKQLNFAIKQAFSDQTIRDFQPIRDVFLNEIYFYKKLWPILFEFQEKIPTKCRFIHIAKCFATNSEDNFERLVFENLKYEGFVIHNKTKPLEKNKFEYIFKLYGRFHAISFAYQALMSEEFPELTNGIYEVWGSISDKPHFQNAIKFLHEYIINCLQPGRDNAIIEKIKHYVDDGVELFRNSLKKAKYNAIIHGDSWSNNMMFKYDDAGELEDIKFLDFQLVRYGSPVCDLSYCLYSGGNKETFDDLDHFLKIYHDSLSENLRAYGCDPEQIYPLQALKDDWKIHCQLGVAMGLMIWRGKLTYEDEILDLTDVSEEDQVDVKKFFETKYDKETYRQITRDMIVHLYENDYLC